VVEGVLHLSYILNSRKHLYFTNRQAYSVQDVRCLGRRKRRMDQMHPVGFRLSSSNFFPLELY
jgi:hypothetical protein